MRGTKLINWSTPKDVQERKEDPDSTRFGSSRKKKATKTYCPKTKGEHKLYWEEKRVGDTVLWKVLTCELCGKKITYNRSLIGRTIVIYYYLKIFKCLLSKISYT